MLRSKLGWLLADERVVNRCAERRTSAWLCFVYHLKQWATFLA